MVTIVDRHPGRVWDYVHIRCEECGWQWAELEPASNPFMDFDEIMNGLPNAIGLLGIRLYHRRRRVRKVHQTSHQASKDEG